jgi:dienelactone hydrolase
MAINQDLSFSSGTLRLVGTLALPDGVGPSPAVLLLPGSGQSDRDDNAPSLRINVLKEIASTLAEHGFASVSL